MTANHGDDEIGSFCGLMVFAGHETTTNLLANSVLALLEHPRELERARGGLSAGAVEELLRHSGPMKAITRTVTTATDFAGQAMQPGDRVLLSLAAATRDPTRFADPDRLDLARAETGQLAFGYGPHYCLGAPLVRLEAQIGLGGLFARFPGLALAVPREQLAWRRTLLIRSLKELPVRLAGVTPA
jgi:cytochrome P450